MCPYSPSTITTSSMRIGCESASCTPAIKFSKSGRAAIPITMPATPALASNVVPSARIDGNVIATSANATNTTTIIAVRARMLMRVSVWRAVQVVYVFEAVAALHEIGVESDRGDDRPGYGDDRRDRGRAHQHRAPRIPETSGTAARSAQRCSGSANPAGACARRSSAATDTVVLCCATPAAKTRTARVAAAARRRSWRRESAPQRYRHDRRARKGQRGSSSFPRARRSSLSRYPVSCQVEQERLLDDFRFRELAAQRNLTFKRRSAAECVADLARPRDDRRREDRPSARPRYRTSANSIPAARGARTPARRRARCFRPR